MQPFSYEQNASRVLFGNGTRKRLKAEAERLGLARVLVLSTAAQCEIAEQMRSLLGDLAVGVFSEAAMHTPVTVTERGMACVRELDADGVVAIGGGSTVGLGKAIAIRTGLPQIVLPTTYAGSEMTPLIGETFLGVKKTQRTSDALPEVVIYDVDLTLSLPIPMSVKSALNAMAHAIEALYAPDGNPITALAAEEGVRAVFSGISRLSLGADDGEVRSELLYGAWLCGRCLGEVSMGLHHKLCHSLGGAFNLPHAEMHAILLPYVLAFNAPVIPDAITRLRHALRSDDPVRTLFQLQRTCAVPLGLREIGMPVYGVTQVVDQVLANPYKNPREPKRVELETLLLRAWAGEAEGIAAR
ncbi:maleylacetate reductase [Variovorax sp. EL159]|uniref:maleylacetate reductase n=1 Tax=Variovorax sp. EL159 TaxID=1566270 RepID=UPI000884929A|nr:maleylacetate reductase [Variovorax sp. EL159]SCX72531.1 Alcohol dehydrogenase, class IV [Variovorax sp. EL159]